MRSLWNKELNPPRNNHIAHGIQRLGTVTVRLGTVIIIHKTKQRHSYNQQQQLHAVLEQKREAVHIQGVALQQLNNVHGRKKKASHFCEECRPKLRRDKFLAFFYLHLFCGYFPRGIPLDAFSCKDLASISGDVVTVHLNSKILYTALEWQVRITYIGGMCHRALHSSYLLLRDGDGIGP